MKKTLHFVIAVVVYIAFFRFVLYRAVGNRLEFNSYMDYSQLILKGWIATILISISALLLSLIVGLLLYIMSNSKILFLRYIAEFHKTIIFGVPLLVIIMAAYYYIGYAFNIDNKFIVGVITLSLYTGAYIADIYRGAIESVHVRQWQAAKMFGFNKYQTYRYIIFPQVIMSILPPLTGQLALLIKGSALLSYMAFDEFFNVIETTQASTFAYAEGFIILAVGYLIMTVPLLFVIRLLEKRFNYRGA
ncbi:amino acid ABC transporter permease [Oceanirhabdus sp. W0125-5]|uniref:amino acid ABC transporter permease n=1 Tax=Oceanirhabdus sp. W0125-5 TaxID=2999116 RepID=UPI0022F2B84E|nr:amino acid ABC transporter permease [Oceanirhabdus sp. W0125-5]WBW97857.1 amino acid ABC transporter permease [Oceanirhabdus sp. W0125-5]